MTTSITTKLAASVDGTAQRPRPYRLPSAWRSWRLLLALLVVLVLVLLPLVGNLKETPFTALLFVTAWLAPRRPFTGPPGGFHRRNNRDAELTALWNQTKMEDKKQEEEASSDGEYYHSTKSPPRTQFPTTTKRANDSQEQQEQQQQQNDDDAENEKANEDTFSRHKRETFDTETYENMGMELFIDEDSLLSLSPSPSRNVQD